MARARNLSLRTKLMAAFVGIGAIPAGILGLCTWQASNGMREDVGDNMQYRAASINDVIDRNLFERYGDVQAFGTNAVIAERESWYQPGSGRNKIAAATNRYMALYGLYELGMMVDLEGRVVAVNDKDAAGHPIDTAFLYSKSFHEEPWFQDCLAQRFLKGPGADGTMVEDVYVDADIARIYNREGLAIGFAAPVYDDGGTMIGVWKNYADFDLVESIVQTAFQGLLAEGRGTAEITILNAAGEIVVDYDPSRNQDGAIHRDLDVLLHLNLAKAGVEAARRSVAGEAGYCTAVHARKKVEQVAGFARSQGALGYPGLGWSVLVRQNTSEALAPILALQRIVAWVFGVSLLVLGIVGWYLAQLISKPILRGLDDLTQTSERVTTVAIQVASTSTSLAQGATEQASSLEESSASMTEIAATTRQNAENSHLAASCMGEVETRVQASRTALSQMVSSMNNIHESSQKISRIIKTIDEIAFQTNILALNAAVEAARAGDAGMGFAVVAGEVRNLAQRSAQAARDTASLIEESIVNAGQGSERVGELVKTVESITGSVARAKSLVDEVNLASQQQSEGVSQIAEGLNQIEVVTQTSAASAEEGSATSQELNALASQALVLVEELRINISGGNAETHDPGVTRPAPRNSKRNEGAIRPIATVRPRRSATPSQVIPLDDSDFEATGTGGY